MSCLVALLLLLRIEFSIENFVYLEDHFLRMGEDDQRLITAANYI